MIPQDSVQNMESFHGFISNYLFFYIKLKSMRYWFKVVLQGKLYTKRYHLTRNGCDKWRQNQTLQ